MNIITQYAYFNFVRFTLFISLCVSGQLSWVLICYFILNYKNLKNNFEDDFIVTTNSIGMAKKVLKILFETDILWYLILLAVFISIKRNDIQCYQNNCH